MSNNPIESINEIKAMIQRSSKFTSISGWSGIWVGIIGLIAAGLAELLILKSKLDLYGLQPDLDRDYSLLLLGLITFVIACSGGFYFMIKKTHRDGEKFINPVSKRILNRFITVLAIGGILCLLLYKHLSFVYIAPTTLLFYGLALYNIEKDTIIEIKYMAIVEIILGLLAFYFIYNGLLFWAIGFGLVHLIFGIKMVLKYDRKP